MEEYNNDPLVFNAVSARLLRSALRASDYLQNTYAQLPAPLLLVHGGEDKITSPKASVRFAKKRENTTLKVLPGLYHEVHNEPEREEVLDHILDWLDGALG